MGMRRFTAADLDTGHVPVTQGLAPAPSLSEALLRKCRDMGPTLESRVSGPLGRHGVLVWAGCGRILMLCYVTVQRREVRGETREVHIVWPVRSSLCVFSCAETGEDLVVSIL